MNNAHYVQLQIKAFNKYMSRNMDKISDEVYEAITDLIDYERMTASGYAKAGSKYLESMTPRELLAYSADIENARLLVDFDMMTDQLEIDNAKDPASALWRMAEKLKNENIAYDSDQIYLVEKGAASNIGFKDMMLQLNKLFNDPDYGLSDITEWWNRKEGLT